MITTQHKRSVAKDLRHLAGKWAAFVDGKIFASAETLPDLMAKLKKRKPAKKASVMLVPRKDEGPYILISL